MRFVRYFFPLLLSALNIARLWLVSFGRVRVAFPALIGWKVSVASNGRRSRIFVGSKVVVRPWATLHADGGRITIGSGVFINSHCMIVSHCSIEVGAGTSIGPGVYIYDHNHIIGDAAISDGAFSCAPVKIGRKCWVGAGAIILKGCSIGDGAVIGAGVIVTQDVPPKTIVTQDRTLRIVSIGADGFKKS